MVQKWCNQCWIRPRCIVTGTYSWSFLWEKINATLASNTRHVCESSKDWICIEKDFPFSSCTKSDQYRPSHQSGTILCYFLWWKAPLWPKWEAKHVWGSTCFGCWWLFTQNCWIHYTTLKKPYCNILIPVSPSSFEIWHVAATTYGSWNRICSGVYCTTASCTHACPVWPSSYLRSLSRHNHRAERLWAEVNARINYPVRRILVRMEESQRIDDRWNNEIFSFLGNNNSDRISNYGLH